MFERKYIKSRCLTIPEENNENDTEFILSHFSFAIAAKVFVQVLHHILYVYKFMLLISNVAGKLGWITIEIEIATNEPFARPSFVNRYSFGRLDFVQKKIVRLRRSASRSIPFIDILLRGKRS